MKKKWLMALAALAVAAGLLLSGCQATSNPTNSFNNQQEGIWVTGQGKVPAVPDIALLQVGIQAEAKTVAQAQAQAGDAMNSVLTALRSNGIADKDIQTARFSIQQVTQYNPQTGESTVTGYMVTNVVNAKIRDLANVGTVVDAAAQAGGDLTRINSISFSVENQTQYLNQARQLAMKDAMDKANALANLAGVRLGKPTLINETTVAPVVPMPAFDLAGGAKAGATPISAGELDVTDTVQVVYSIR